MRCVLQLAPSEVFSNVIAEERRRYSSTTNF